MKTTMTGRIAKILDHGRKRVRFLLQAVVAAITCFAICLGAFKALADDPPMLTIDALGGNQFNVTITNAANPTNYLLWWTPVLGDPNYEWQVVATNAPGATNWVLDMGPWPVGFMKVMVGWDGDNDSVADWMDAQPLNPDVGVLAVTIDSPINGSSLY